MPKILDPIDREHLQQVAVSRGYQLIVIAMRSIADAKIRDLQRDLDSTETAKARGYIEALVRVMNLPEEILKQT